MTNKEVLDRLKDTELKQQIMDNMLAERDIEHVDRFLAYDMNIHHVYLLLWFCFDFTKSQQGKAYWIDMCKELQNQGI